jgi:hypothetical protein
VSVDEQAIAHPANLAILATREWFSPQRWSVNDALMAVAAIVLGGSVLGPWFRATVKFKTAPLVGSLIEPKGERKRHRGPSLLAGGGCARAGGACGADRAAPDRHAVPVAGYHRLLAFISVLICVGVMVGFLWRPTTWPGISQRELGPFFQLVIGWGFGSVAALGAALVSRVAARWHLQRRTSARRRVRGCRCPAVGAISRGRE